MGNHFVSPKKLAKIPRRRVAIYQNLGFEDNRGVLHSKKWLAKASSFYNFVSGLFRIIFVKSARKI
jgi:hypothetical protein